MLKQDGKDPIQAAIEEAEGCEAIDFSRIDWQTLHNNLSFDIAVCRTANELGDSNLLVERYERARAFRRLMDEAKVLYDEDSKDDRRIARHYPLRRPEPLSVLADLKKAAERALEPVKDPPEVGNAGERILSKLTENTFLNTVTERMARRFKEHFKMEAWFTKKSGRFDGPFLRMAQVALREYGEKPYALSSIARALQESRAKEPRPRAKRKRTPQTARCQK